MGNRVHRVRVQAAGDVGKLAQGVKSSRTLSLWHSLLALSGNHLTLIKPPGWQDKNRNRVLVSLEGWHTSWRASRRWWLAGDCGVWRQTWKRCVMDS